MKLEELADVPAWDWPEDAAETIRTVLGDGSAGLEQRLLAADLAGMVEVMDDDTADALLAVAGKAEEELELRIRAAISLGPLFEYTDMMRGQGEEEVLVSAATYERVDDATRALFRDESVPAEVRRAVLEASSRAPRDWHRDAVRAAYRSDDPDWRLTAVFCMRSVPGFQDEILQSLASNEPGMQYQAVCAAGEQRVDPAWLVVSALVREPIADQPLLLAAIESAAEIRPSEALTLLQPLTGSPDEEIAAAAEDALDLARALLENDTDNRR
ncbi:MAG: hypothetical protein R6X25_07085 [Candidatus Krumholzibacteriia bacterium]